MDLSLDILRNDGFSVVNLTRVAGTTTYVPQQLGAMGIFEPEPIIGKIVHLYEEDGQIRLVPTTERGAPDIRNTRDVGRLRALQTPRLSQIDSVNATELVSIANMVLPETVRLRNAMDVISKRTVKLKSNQEATKELHRFGALQGKVLDADGTRVIADFFTEYGIAAPTMIDIDWANTTEDDLMMYFQDTFLRPMEVYLRTHGRFVPGIVLGALVGDAFWRKLMTHPGFRSIWKLNQQAQFIAMAQNPLSKPNMWDIVEFAGIRWMNFRSSVGLSTEIAIPTTEARFFPIGAPDVFKVFWGSGEKLEDATLPGKPEYLYLEPDQRRHPEFMDVILRSYGLYACLLPGVLMKARNKP